MALLWHASINATRKIRAITLIKRLNGILLRKYCKTQESLDTGNKSTPKLERKSVTFTCGKYANLADSCVVAEYGGTAVMATVVGKGQPCSLEVPLTINYHQKAAAIGRIPTNFLRRELGPSDHEVLVSRIIDRSLRPLFTPGSAIETQIICNPLALDGENFPDVVAVNAASAALMCSDIPWNGPVACARVAMIGNEVVVNPTKVELNQSSVNLVVSSMTNNLIVMIEGHCNNITLPDIQKCLSSAVKYCKNVLASMQELKDHEKEKRTITPFAASDEVYENLKVETEGQLKYIFSNITFDKLERDRAIQLVFKNSVPDLQQKFPGVSDEIISAAFFKILKNVYKSIVLESDQRCDGRSKLCLRPITCEAGLYKALHGSSVFKRGQTQVFCTVALDSPNSALRMDRVSVITSGLKEKNFFVHYQFPPFATGEIGADKRRTRREVGHGTLAENALKSAIPQSFPFAIRLTSEVLESNGSSSMATVCGGTMALLDAGVPLEFPVAGVAMGLLANVEDGVVTDCHILTDIIGLEDYLGDMDFKIAGTKTGITAIQLDMKVPGLQLNVVFQTLVQAKKALAQIFRQMENVIKEPRSQSNDNWPVMKSVVIPPHTRLKLFGIGGLNIKKLELEVGVEFIEVEPGKYSLFAPNKSALDETLSKIEEIIACHKEQDLEFGGIYTATVVEMKDNGCFVTLYPNMTPAFIALSQLDIRRVSHPSALGIEVGSEFAIKYFGRDPITGSMRISRKVLLGKDDTN